MQVSPSPCLCYVFTMWNIPSIGRNVKYIGIQMPCIDEREYVKMATSFRELSYRVVRWVLPLAGIQSMTALARHPFAPFLHCRRGLPLFMSLPASRVQEKLSTDRMWSPYWATTMIIEMPKKHIAMRCDCAELFTHRQHRTKQTTSTIC